MREITDQLVQKNMRFFSLRHAWRKAIPFLHRTMTLGVVHGSYNLYSSFPSIARSVRELTEGLRRSYLVDHTSFKRNIQGPWQTVSAFATFGMQISDWCTARAIRGATDKLDLYKGFHDIVMAFLHVPITFSAKISSLHSWLFTNVLDISSMALFSFMLFVTGFRTFCPLHALAARGQSLSDAQQARLWHSTTPSARPRCTSRPLASSTRARQGS